MLVFYRQALACVLAWWGLIFFITRQSLHRVTASSVITRPSWLPARCVLFLQRHRRIFFFGAPISTAVACLNTSLLTRIFSAVAFALYHLTESSMTNRHGEYPILQIMLALCLPDDRYAHAAAFGLAVNFVLSTGFAKVSVGGFNWLHPETMRTYLDCYRESKSAFSRPLSPSLNEAISGSNACLVIVSISTILIECGLVPATLFLPPDWRPIACYTMIAMHVGIAFVMSLKVGVVFSTSLPTYLYGFHCSDKVGTGPWILAALVGLLPTIVSTLIGSSIYPEDWPFTPVSLFMWSHKSAKALLKLFMTGDTRMVFATNRVALDGKIVGMRVVHFGESARIKDKHQGCVHDAVMRSIGFTLVQGGLPLLRLVSALRSDQITGMTRDDFVTQTQLWLAKEKRLFEAHTGEVLTSAYFVRVDENLRVSEILFFRKPPPEHVTRADAE